MVWSGDEVDGGVELKGSGDHDVKHLRGQNVDGCPWHP